MTTAIQEATAFLAPVFDRNQLQSTRETSLILRLSKPLSPTTTEPSAARTLVITRALELLRRLHEEISARDARENALRLERPGERRAIFGLVDLLILEGIYPALPPGVGVPIERRARSTVLPSQVPKVMGRVTEVEHGDRDLLKGVVRDMGRILRRSEEEREKEEVIGVARAYKGLEGMIRERALVDLLAGCGDLAYNPDFADEGQEEWQTEFEELTHSIPTGTLMPLLISLLHPNTPAWFRQTITRTLALLPISRLRAVQSILEMFLTTSAGPGATPQTAQLSTDTLSRASRLISAVPNSLSPRDYFSRVCPQLLDLLHGNPGLERAAAYVVVELLGKPGDETKAVIETEIIGKITSSFDPPAPPPAETQLAPPAAEPSPTKKVVKTSSALLDLEDTPAPVPASKPLVFEIPDETFTPPPQEPVHESALVSESDLSTALRTLELLLAAHPSPLVSERIISRILLPLWGLLGYAKSTGRSAWYERVWGILRSHFAVSLDLSLLRTLQENISYTGGETWCFGPGDKGGIEIRRKWADDKKGADMELIDARVSEFLKILEIESVKSTLLSDYFLGLFRTWLARGREEEPLQMLVTVKILQELLGTHGEELAKQPTEILQIVGGVLDEYIATDNSPSKPVHAFQNGAKPPAAGLEGLRNLVTELPDTPDDDTAETRSETVAMALSLLSVIISSPDTKLTESDTRLLHALQPALTTLSKSEDPSLRPLASNLLPLLPLHAPTKQDSTPTPLAEQQRQSYQTALSYLTDPLIPVRAHGLHLLRSLILARAPIIDVVATARLLIDMIRDGDSYVYLNVIKCLAALTTFHGATVVRMLVEEYMDERQALGLDERLRVGEALGGTVERMGAALTGATAKDAAEAMVAVVSRRRKRSRKEGADGAEKPAVKRKDEEEDEEDDEDEEFDEDGNPLTEKDKLLRDHQFRIVSGWSAGRDVEDLRIRTSALSILSLIVAASPLAVTPRILREALDLALSVLQLETKPEEGILRRAAVVGIGSVVAAVVKDSAEDTEGGTWRDVVWRVVEEKRADVERVLGYLRGTDNDGLVREQAGVVVGNLRAVVERRVLGGRATVGGEVRLPAAGGIKIV